MKHRRRRIARHRRAILACDHKWKMRFPRNAKRRILAKDPHAGHVECLRCASRPHEIRATGGMPPLVQR